jgi:branched-chain amino acid transport system substrate-binding protein
MSALRWAAIAALALSPGVAAVGCSPAADDSATGPLTVYVSAPLRGEHGAQGRDIADGARLALADAGGIAGEVEVELEILDDTGGPRGDAAWTPSAVAANARKAAQDSSAIAYIGDFESGATRISLPITNQALLPQVSAASTALDLVGPPEGGTEVPELVQPSGERSFVRVIPDDGVQAEAAAAWARQLGMRRAAAVSDSSELGDQMVEEFAEAASGLGIDVVESGLQGDLPSQSQLIYLAGDGERAGLQLQVVAAGPGPLLMATDVLLLDADYLADITEPHRIVGFTLGGEPLERRLRLTAAAQAAEQLPPSGQEFAAAFEDEYGRAPGPYAAYGYEAMALVLDAIQRAGEEAEDRRAVLGELLATRDRESVLGTYSITAVGNTTLDAIAGYRIEAGEPVFDRGLEAP